MRSGFNLPSRIRVFDTTLRDGEQTPGVSLTPEEKIEIAIALEELGVDVIEAGFPITSDGEVRAVKEIAKTIKEASLSRSEVCALARSSFRDIDLAVESGVDSVHVFIATSPLHREYKLRMSKEEVLERAVEAVEYAKSRGVKVEFSAEDATRTELDFLIKVFKAVEEAGVDRVDIPDTVGVMTPTAMRYLVSEVVKELRVPVSVHCHNDFGLAVANSLAAVESGAQQAHVTVNGIGERAGNASLEQFVVSLHHLYGVKTNIDTTKLRYVSELIEKLTGIQVPPNYPIVGDNAFSHESGIHVHGVLEHPGTYEPLAPEAVGMRRRIVLGKHTGRHAVEEAIRRLGYRAEREEVDEIVRRIKEAGDMGIKVTDKDFGRIVDEVIGSREGARILEVSEWLVVTGSSVTPSAFLKVRLRDKELRSYGWGVGPVDALSNALRTIEGIPRFKLSRFKLNATSRGTEAEGEVYVKLEAGSLSSEGYGISRDILRASLDALLDALNKVMSFEDSCGEDTE
ncbi:MAG: 2-isopropylmalate synthase [Candidatus Korarchaeum sp.]|nr:2-isopropylmalate synthase [Candidatus Korarchaeum sp.]MDW8036211.1 2-isopropylmalate synthase [Candidatus Korarchaeum sp.]